MKLYYRHRQNGVLVFRMEVANRQRRIELNQIASISKTGDIIPHKRRAPTDEEVEEMTAWWATWQARKDADSLTDTEQFLVQLNQFTDWVQRRAEDGEVDALSDDLLTALLDLRHVVVRRLSDIDAPDQASG
jgi:hypothetical protein